MFSTVERQLEYMPQLRPLFYYSVSHSSWEILIRLLSQGRYFIENSVDIWCVLCLKNLVVTVEWKCLRAKFRNFTCEHFYVNKTEIVPPSYSYRWSKHRVWTSWLSRWVSRHLLFSQFHYKQSLLQHHLLL